MYAHASEEKYRLIFQYLSLDNKTTLFPRKVVRCHVVLPALLLCCCHAVGQLHILFNLIAVSILSLGEIEAVILKATVMVVLQPAVKDTTILYLLSFFFKYTVNCHRV